MSDWQALQEAAVLDDEPEDRFGMIGIWQEEDGWHYRPERKIEIRIPAASVPMKRLRDSFAMSSRVEGREVERVMVLVLGQTTLGGQDVDWRRARKMIGNRLEIGVAAVALGGVRSSECDVNGVAAPLALGELAVAGHLEPSIDRAAAALARRHGLAGFRFSDDSWWTEDYLGGKEDPTVGRERLDEIVSEESWPWLTLIVAVPASGAAAEAGAIATAQSLLGALVMLDQSPGTGWNEAVPWVAGGLGPAGDPRWPGDESRDWLLPIAPQHVDAATRRLDNAENDLGGVPGRVIDLAAHSRGPGAALLRAVVDSSLDGDPSGDMGRLALACRAAWLAGATETASTRWALARSAAEALTLGEGSVLALAEAGARWRHEVQDDWPEGCSWGSEVDLDSWVVDMPGAATALSDDLSHPSWGAAAAEQSLRALDLVQAAFFGKAAEMQAS